LFCVVYVDAIRSVEVYEGTLL